MNGHRTVIRHVTRSGHTWLVTPCPAHGPACWESHWRFDPDCPCTVCTEAA